MIADTDDERNNDPNCDENHYEPEAHEPKQEINPEPI
jgi:hypothetical protein